MRYRILLLVLAGFFLFVLSQFLMIGNQKIYDDGLWPLTVKIQSTGNRQIVAAWGESVHKDDEFVKERLETPPPVDPKYYSSPHGAIANPLSGDSFVVPVPTSETTTSNACSTSKRFFQYSKVLVIVQFNDGTREGQVLDIPDMRDRTNRRVIAVFP